MATLILTTVGSQIAGPLGALVGSVLGNRLDKKLLGGGRPRAALDESRLLLDSEYGAPIPMVFGRARVAGHVIWASDISERRRDRPRGGKGGGGGGGNTKFSYFISLSVAVSARRVARIERIWADGKLLLDRNGQPLVPFSWTLYPGGEDQEADPEIQAVEGASDTPPLRGLAHVVIEDLPLSAFGNRIPNLSFEVVADETLTLADLLVELTERAGLSATASPALSRPVTGLAVTTAPSIRAAIEAVAATFDVILREGPGMLAFTAPEDAEAVTLDETLFGAGRPARVPTARIERERRDRTRLPTGIDLAFHDPGRDFERAVEGARRRQASGARIETVETSFVLDPPDARAQAQRLLAARLRHGERMTASLPLADSLRLEVGDRLDLPDGGAMLVLGLEADGGLLVAEGAPALLPAVALAPPPAATPAFPPVLLPPPGPTRAHLLDFPGLLRAEDEPVLPVALSGASAGWRSGALYASLDAGESFTVVAETDAPAVVGDVESPPAAGPVSFWDEANSLSVRLLNSEMTLESRSHLAVLNGANLAMVGDELLQFRNAVLQADGSYLLSGLLRGRQGTEHAVAGHKIGEPFVLIDGGGLADARIPLALAGRRLEVKGASNLEDPDAVPPAQMTVALNALKPLSPVHLAARRLANGDVEFTWIRRARRNGAWLDGADVPLDEECACYEVEILDQAGGVVRVLTAAAERAVYTAGDQQADFGTLPASISITLYQLSARVGRGWPASATFAL